MSRKADRLKRILKPLAGGDWDAHYLAYFECFNRQEYYEAHELLEELWLTERTGPNGPFYRGLIQLAGAFVHLQKQRFAPAASLLKTAQNSLRPYPSIHHGLNIGRVLELTRDWLHTLERGRFSPALLSPQQAPQLALEDRKRCAA